MTEGMYRTFFIEPTLFNFDTCTATFRYSFDRTRMFEERVQFEVSSGDVPEDIFERLLELAAIVVGTSYYKCFPTTEIAMPHKRFSPKQAAFVNKVYREGLSQFIFENGLDSERLAHVTGHGHDTDALMYGGEGILAMQSGGKDSLLVGELLNEKNHPFTSFYVSSTKTYPKIIARLNGKEPRVAHRFIDHKALRDAAKEGGLNGHVPITYIVTSFALIDAVLHGENIVVQAIGNEGNEPHTMFNGLPVNHQWSKTWEAEQLLADYVASLISPDIRVGSPLRALSELRIAELFEELCWAPYSYGFSSCNVANYKQGALNTDLHWCGKCPKCANMFLLFSPFVIPYDLRRLFDGQDLFSSQNLDLQKAFKGLLGVGGVMKPLECVGEVDELRTAYQMARQTYGYQACQLPFEVPEGHFAYQQLGPQQPWTKQLVRSLQQEKS